MADRDLVSRSGNASPLTAAQHDSNLDSLSGTVEAWTGAGTIDSKDQNKTIECTHATGFTVTLDPVATIVAAIDTTSFRVGVKNIGAGPIVIDADGTETIDGYLTVTLEQFESVTLQINAAATGWNSIGGIKKNSVLDYGVDPTGVADTAVKVNQYIADHSYVYFPAGEYVVDAAYFLDKSDFAIIGAGSDVCTLKIKSGGTGNFSVLDARTSVIATSLSNITIRGFTIDGNESAHTGTGNNGILVLVDSDTHSITNVTIEDVTVKNSKIHGIALQGYADGIDNLYAPIDVTIRNCNLLDNKGAGLSQFKVKNTLVEHNHFDNNAYENMTIDVYSNGCQVLGNHFRKHLGGTGNIGIDASSRCLIANNLIDNESDTSAAAYNRNGISSNAQHAGTNEIVIANNIIINCANAGIFIRDSESAIARMPGGGASKEYPFETNGFIFPQYDDEGTATSADATGVTLTDSGATWVTDEYVDALVYNYTDGSSGVIASNTGTTVTVTAGLAGGTNDDWEIGDQYYICPYDKAGQALIVGNNLVNNGTNGYTTGVDWEADIVINDSNGPVHVKANKYDKIVSEEPTASTVRMEAGDIAWQATLASFPQTVVDDGAWKTVPFATLANGRLVTLASNKITTTVGCWIHVNAKVRIDTQNLSGTPTYVSLALTGTATGVVKIVNYPTPFPTDEILEIELDYLGPLATDDYYIQTRSNGAGTGTIDIVGTSSETWFHGISVG